MDVELIEGAPEFGRLIAAVEEAGERVRVATDGEPARALLTAAEPAVLEYWAARHNKGARPEDEPGTDVRAT
ncbi:hypothetical protein ABZ471_30450 [Streptomyces sp. NPDC005728]|uniref:hypothetical protein n=1 Tax=Streptomyces sp. NPDC005728 TaxID=3157054 RepID=UPI0033F41178